MAARSMEEQAAYPKIIKLIQPVTAATLRPILKSVGIDVTPLDEVIATGERAKQGLKEAPKEANKEEAPKPAAPVPPPVSGYTGTQNTGGYGQMTGQGGTASGQSGHMGH
jgi:hypothetical protein